MIKKSLFNIYNVEIIVSDLDHPECVNFGPDGAGYAGGEAGQLFKFTSERDKVILANTGGRIGGLCVDGNYT
ncbi:hypothetical protein [Ferviditalea candida]|uniref:Uncharacterized protein n=1 Tax=Ferviditalea candida TaxID=3108399 RepID=A0ABU5ZEM6_9BACL|nr:hypothetical protein [Paenibacillaceae bacterium T2]